MSITLLEKRLRARINDTLPNTDVFSVECTDTTVTSAVLSISSAKLLTTTIVGGTASSLSIDLTAVAYNTIWKLAWYIESQSGYSVVLHEDTDGTTPSVDIAEENAVDITVERQLKAYQFSTDHLQNVLMDAVPKFNSGYQLTESVCTVPREEWSFPIDLAAIAIYYELAAKYAEDEDLIDSFGEQRETRSERYRKLAESLRREYEANLSRLTTSYVVPLEDTPLQVSWQSPHTGLTYPATQSPLPTAVRLANATQDEITDSTVRLHWSRPTFRQFGATRIYYNSTVGVTPLTGTKYSEFGDPIVTTDKIYGLDASTTYYFVIATYNDQWVENTDNYENWALSNEIEVTTDA